MNLDYTDDQKTFRDEVRRFLDEKLPARLTGGGRDRRGFTKAEHEEWHAILHEKGWLAANWPKEFGGAALDAVERHILEDEMTRAGAPRIVPFGIAMLGPVLQKFGSKAQQDHYLPRILNGDDWWCQGYSEPGAGSDLASLRCGAVRDGDHYVVNGQKTWTTMGQYANMIFCLVRTSKEGKPQEGISFLLIDMDTPGVEVRPIVLIDGSAEVNEVWFTDVRVPGDLMVGEPGQGWTIAKFLLGNERVGVAPVGQTKRVLEQAKEHAAELLADDPGLRARVIELENDLLALELTALRVVAHSADGEPHPASSVLKLRGSELQQAVSELVVDLAGPASLASGEGGDALAWHRRTIPTYLNLRKASIYGGSNEVQRQIISRTILGL